jgi:hypothetical protein
VYSVEAFLLGFVLGLWWCNKSRSLWRDLQSNELLFEGRWVLQGEDEEFHSRVLELLLEGCATRVWIFF